MPGSFSENGRASYWHTDVTFVEAFGWSRAQVSLAYSVSQIVNGVSSPLVGWLVEANLNRSFELAGEARTNALVDRFSADGGKHFLALGWAFGEIAHQAEASLFFSEMKAS